MTAQPNWASILSALGRGGDTMVAHLNPREAAILKALGGAGTVNPKTGLLEFDDQGGSSGGSDVASVAPTATATSPTSVTSYLPGGTPEVSPTSTYATGDISTALAIQPQTGGLTAYGAEQASYGNDTGLTGWTQDPSSGVYYGPQGQVSTTLGGSDLTTYYTPTQQGLLNSYITNYALPSDAVPLSASSIAEKSNLPTDVYGYVNLPEAYSQSYIATPGNSNFTIDPTTDTASFTDTGWNAYENQYKTAAESNLVNQAHSESGLSGLLASPVFDLTAIAGLVGAGVGLDALGAVTGAAATGADTATSAVDAATAASDAASAAGSTTDISAALQPITASDISTTTATSAADAAASAGIPTTALADSGTAAGAAGATDAAATAADPTAALTAATTPATTGATDLTTGITATDLASTATPSADLTGAASAPYGFTPATTDITGSSAAASGPSLADSSGSIFLGGTDSSSLGGTATDLSSLGAAPDSSLPITGYDITGVTTPDSALNASGGSGIGGWLSKAGSWLGDKALSSLSNNPLGAIASIGGLGYTLLSGGTSTNSYSGGSALSSAAQSAANTATSLSNEVSSGTLPSADQTAINSENTTANSLSTQASLLESYLNNGTLPTGVAAQIKAETDTAKAAIRSKYAAMGMSGSSSEVQDLANADLAGVTAANNVQTSLYSTGVSEATTAANIIGNVATQTASITSNLLSSAESYSALSSELYSNILNTNITLDSNLGKAISSLASAVTQPTTIKLSTGATTS